MILADRIRNGRIKKNYTQKQLSKIMKVSVATISFWENGRKIPSSKNLNQLSKILGTPMDYLLGNDVYVMADNAENYNMAMAKEEINVIVKLRKYEKLYKMIVENPDRAFERISNKFF